MQKAWTDDAWADYLHWQTQDRKTLKRINKLIDDIDRHPFTGIGKQNWKTAYNRIQNDSFNFFRLLY